MAAEPLSRATSATSQPLGWPRYGPAQSAFGSEEAAGEVAFCDPEHRIAVGFVRSQLDMTGRFSAGLIDARYRCVGERA